jgi:hypothetical protein
MDNYTFDRINESHRFSTDDSYHLHPRNQLMLIFISVILFYIWYNQLFTDPNINFIMLYFCIINTLWELTILARYIYLGFGMNNNLTDGKSHILIHVPDYTLSVRRKYMSKRTCYGMDSHTFLCLLYPWIFSSRLLRHGLYYIYSLWGFRGWNGNDQQILHRSVVQYVWISRRQPYS